jgi:hypothetical protein
MKRLRTAAPIAITLAVLFARLFDPLTPRWWVDAIWLAALAVWSGTVWTLRPRGRRWQPRNAIPLAILLVVFCAAWLPFFDNWRWAFMADSGAWFEVPYNAGRNGLHQSLLSVRGVDENFTYLHSIALNVPMMLIEPNMFWHRVGKLLVSVAALGSIYLFFAMTIGRAWALVVAFAVATNYVWIWFSYVSYGHIASYVVAFLSLAFATLIWRAPENPVNWLACGLIGGLSLFFTQTAWAEVAAVGAALTVFAVRRRRPDLWAIYAVAALLVALPYALQWEDVRAMFARNAGGSGAVDAGYWWRIFQEILVLPSTSVTHDLGVNGGFMRPPLDWLYVAGAVLALLGVNPRLRRALAIPAVAPIVLALLLFDALLMTFTNNAYGNISTKRAYHLIPYFLFLALLPFMVLQMRARGWWSRGAWALTAGALTISVAANARLIITPPRGMYGFTVFDGLIELRQRFPHQLVTLFTSRGSEFANAVQGPESAVAREYQVTDIVILEERFDAAGLADACAAQALLCYEPEFDQESFATMMTPYGALLSRVEFYDSQDMQCFWPLPSLPNGG